MKRLALVLALIPSAALAGPGLLGTKVDSAPAAGAAAPVGVMPLIQMALALAIVIGLVKVVLPKLVGKSILTGKSSPDLKVESSLNLGNGAIHVIQAKGRTLLVGATTNGFSCLADLTTDAPTAPIAIDSRDDEFAELLAKVRPEPVAAARPMDDVALALERLRALED